MSGTPPRHAGTVQRGRRRGTTGRHRREGRQKPGQRLPARFWLLTGSTVSANAADGFLYLAAPLLILTFTTDPVLVSLPIALMQVVQFLVGAPLGVAVDHFDRSRVMLIAATARAAIVAGLAVGIFTGMLHYWMLVTALLVGASFEVAFDSAASAAAPDSIDNPDHLETALGRVSSAQQVVQGFIAGPLASVLFSILRVLPFASAAVLYAGAAMQALILRRGWPGRFNPLRDITEGARDNAVPAQPPQADSDGAEDASARDDLRLTDAMMAQLTQFGSSMGDGVRVIRDDRGLRVLLGFGFGAVTLFAFTQAAFAWYLITVLQVPTALVGTLFTMLAVGGIAGSITAGPLARRLGRFPTFVAGVSFTALGALAMALCPRGDVGIPVLMALLILTGLGSGWWNISLLAARQRAVPRNHLGRVGGLYAAASAAASAGATILGGFVSRENGRLPWIIASVGIAVLLVVLGRALRTAFQATTASQSAQSPTSS